jgi:hypothetical protein
MDKSNRNATLDWTSEDEYWRGSFSHRPYAGSKDYDYFQPAYRYGYESAQRFPNRSWEDVESDLRTGWDKYEHRRGATTWQEVKHAVRDAWDRMVGNR